MECGCTKGGENIYLRCRKEAAKYNERLKSREGASEMLGISVSSLANYELGITKVIPPDVVIMMADLYNAPQLKANYCAKECPIGKGVPIATEINSIELVTVKIMKALAPTKVEDVREKLIDIAADGIISDEEKPLLAELVSFLDDVSQVVGELRLLSQRCLSGGKENEDSG